MMQTWLPLPSFQQSVMALETNDLKLQCAQVLELMERFHCIEDSKLPTWYKPAYSTDIDPLVEDEDIFLMWRGYEMQLCEYGLEACEEYRLREPSEDNLYDEIYAHLEWATGEDSDFSKPNWFGDVDFHISHQAALVRRNPDFYRRVFRVDPNEKLVWPVSNHA